MTDFQAIVRFGLTPVECAEIVRMIDEGEISRTSGKKLMKYLREQNMVKLKALYEAIFEFELEEEQIIPHVKKRLGEYWDTYAE